MTALKNLFKNLAAKIEKSKKAHKGKKNIGYSCEIFSIMWGVQPSRDVKRNIGDLNSFSLGKQNDSYKKYDKKTLKEDKLWYKQTFAAGVHGSA